jgi:hypothetical protein
MTAAKRAPTARTEAKAAPFEPKVGRKVRIERDEKLYPSKGTWPKYRGLTGTVVGINVDTERPHLTEYGVGFGKSRRAEAWFKAYELAPVRRGSRTE